MSASQIMNGPPPEHAAATRMRRFQLFAAAAGKGSVRRGADPQFFDRVDPSSRCVGSCAIRAHCGIQAMARLTLRHDFGTGQAIGREKIRLIEAVRDDGSISAGGRTVWTHL